jgi:hypothetical protein
MTYLWAVCAPTERRHTRRRWQLAALPHLHGGRHLSLQEIGEFVGMSCICAVVAAELTAANCMHGSPQAKADQQQLLGALRELGREFSALVCVLLPITMFIALARPCLRTVVLCIVGALTSARASFD